MTQSFLVGDDNTCPNRRVPQTPERPGTVWSQKLCFHWSVMWYWALGPFLTQQVSASPLAFPARVRSLERTSKFPPPDGCAYRSALRMTFLLSPGDQNRLFRRFRASRYTLSSDGCLGFGCWVSKSSFWGWHPTGGNYGSQLLWSSVWDGAALGTALTNKSKLLERSRWRTYSKQHFTALPQRVWNNFFKDVNL